MDEYSSGVIEVTSQHFPEKSEEIHEKQQNDVPTNIRI